MAEEKEKKQDGEQKSAEKEAAVSDRIIKREMSATFLASKKLDQKSVNSHLCELPSTQNGR
jgi:hypothetical protein